MNNSHYNNQYQNSGGSGGGYQLQHSSSSMSLNQLQSHQHLPPNQLSGVGRPSNCEDQLILRLPPQLADRVRKMIKQKQIDTPIDVSFKDDRQIQFKFGQEEYNAALIDLPCVLESHKTLDKMSYFKTGDIGQMIQVFDNNSEQTNDPNNNNNNNSNINTLQDIPKDYQSTSGITPPTKDIVKKRFTTLPKEKVLEIAKIEEEVIRLIKPSYNEQEEAEFVTLEELREQYGTEMFSTASTDTIIFEERADDQVALDEEDSGDDIDHDEDNEGGFMTLKIKTKPNAMTRRDIGGFDDDDFDDKPSPPPRRLTYTGPSPGRPSSMSPLDSEKSPSSGIINANGDFIPVKKERKTRSDKGKERVPHHLKAANQHLYQNQQHHQHHQQPQQPHHPPTSTVSAPLSSSGGGLKIKLPLSSLTGTTPPTIPPQSPSIGDVDIDGFRIPEDRRSVMSPGGTSTHHSPLSPNIGTTTTTTSTVSTGGSTGGGDEERRRKRKEKEGGSSEERHKHRKERKERSEGGHDGERRKKRREREREGSEGGSGEPFSPQEMHPSTPTSTTPSIIVKIPNLQGSSSTIVSSSPPPPPQLPQQSTPTLQDIQIQVHTPPLMQEVSSPPVQQQQPISNIVNTPPPLPITPPLFNVETPPPPPQTTAAVDSTTTILQSISTLRKLQVEAESLKKKIDDAQQAMATILNKIHRDRHQEKIDKMVVSYSDLLKEIERLEDRISQK